MDNLQQALEDGVRCYRAGRLAEAIEDFRHVAALMPNDPEAHFNLGVLLTEAKRPSEATSSFERAVTLKPDHSAAHNGLGHAFMSLGMPDRAVSCFERVCALNPGAFEAFGNLGNALQALGNLDEAAAAYRRSISLKPGDARAHKLLGDMLNRVGRTDEAVAAYQKALALRPDFIEANNNLGNIFTNQGKPELARTYFERALASQPDNAILHYNLANTLRDLGEPDEAMGRYRRAAALKPDHAEAHSNLGNLLSGLGRLEEATQSFRLALALRPNDVEAHINLGTALLDQGRQAEAIAVAHSAEKLDVVTPVHHYLLGVFLARCGLVGQAATHLRASLAGDPEDRNGARLALAALGAAELPASISPAHVDRLYADRARSWDRTATGAWPYRGAELVARSLNDFSTGSEKLAILDAGCGTGLIGALVRERASRLDGVDLSAEMIEQAARKNIYDNLYCCDLVEYMKENQKKYDAITCAATLIHFGDLAGPFAAAAAALRDGGWFVLTLFPNDKEDEAGGVAVSVVDGLAQGGCYAHSRSYIAHIAAASAFEVISLDTETHEYYRGNPRDGLVVALRRRARDERS